MGLQTREALNPRNIPNRFGWAYKREDLYPWELDISGSKKSVSKQAHETNTQHYKKMFYVLGSKKHKENLKENWSPGVPSEKFGGGAAVCSPLLKNLTLFMIKIYHFLILPHLWPDQIFGTLFMTVAADTVALNIIFEGLLLVVLSIKMKSRF